MNDESTRKRGKTHSAGEKATPWCEQDRFGRRKAMARAGFGRRARAAAIFKIMIGIGVGQQGGDTKSVLRGSTNRNNVCH